MIPLIMIVIICIVVSMGVKFKGEKEVTSFALTMIILYFVLNVIFMFTTQTLVEEKVLSIDKLNDIVYRSDIDNNTNIRYIEVGEDSEECIILSEYKTSDSWLIFSVFRLDLSKTEVKVYIHKNANEIAEDN